MASKSPFTIMYKNWKMSSLYVTGSSAALWYFYDYTMTNDMMKLCCKRAATYGDMRLKHPNEPIKHITVILNPVAGKRKSKKLYEKWVEPLLNLAGIKVSLIETESPNQAYELMKIMSNCDGVAIVGGDGTVHEALNGLLSRSDSIKATQRFPIGIIPTGQYNSIARYIHQDNINYRNHKEFMIQATMRMVESNKQKYDVLKAVPLDEELKKTEPPVYALRDIRYGVYQDNLYKLCGIRVYQNYIKPLWLRLKRTFSTSKYPAPKIEAISYTEPCIGCTSCYNKHKLKENEHDRGLEVAEVPSANKRWWGKIAPPTRMNVTPTEEDQREIELSRRENPNCQRLTSIGDAKFVTDFRACMMGDKMVRLSLGRNREYQPSDVIETQDIKLRLSEELDHVKKMATQTTSSSDSSSNEESNTGSKPNDKNNDDDKDMVKFLIDGQPTLAHSLDITAIDRAVTIFTGPFKILIPKEAKR